MEEMVSEYGGTVVMLIISTSLLKIFAQILAMVTGGGL